jgi:hypothetical protein
MTCPVELTTLLTQLHYSGKLVQIGMGPSFVSLGIDY